MDEEPLQLKILVGKSPRFDYTRKSMSELMDMTMPLAIHGMVIAKGRVIDAELEVPEFPEYVSLTIEFEDDDYIKGHLRRLLEAAGSLSADEPTKENA